MSGDRGLRNKALHNRLRVGTLGALLRSHPDSGALARTIADELLPVVEAECRRRAAEAEQAVARVRELHKPVMNWTAPECEACTWHDDECDHYAPSPCPTLRALDGKS